MTSLLGTALHKQFSHDTVLRRCMLHMLIQCQSSCKCEKLIVAAGVDVPALLQRFGLKPSDTGEKVGTLAIAYAAHKALSPVRFPPTVALTPVVAKLIGKKPNEADKPQDL